MEGLGQGIAALIIACTILMGAVCGWLLTLLIASGMWFVDMPMPLWGWIAGPVAGGIGARVWFKMRVE